MMGIAVPQGEDNYKSKNALKIIKNLLLQHQMAKFNQTSYKLSLGEGNSSFSNKGPGPLQRGDKNKNVKMGWGH
jgi:hypothetical protein